MTPKIATCCYCGTRAALVLKGENRHELACSSCGAPLHDLKRLRADHVRPRNPVRPSRTHPAPKSRDKYRKKKGKKSFKRRFLEEAWDVLEDIFD